MEAEKGREIDLHTAPSLCQALCKVRLQNYLPTNLRGKCYHPYFNDDKSETENGFNNIFKVIRLLGSGIKM